MDRDLKNMLKKVTMFDVIIGLFTFIVMFFLAFKYTLPAISGLIMSVLSFCSNTFISDYTVNRQDGSKLWIFLGFLIRIVLVSVIGLMFFMHNRYDLVAYMLGYSLHFISLVLYGLSIKNVEGK